MDDTIQEGKLKVFDNNKNSQKDIEVFDYLEIEPLKLECQHFLNCIENDKTPRSDGENGYMIVKILEEGAPRGMEIIGPAECPIEKINSSWRYQILLKGGSIVPLQNAARKLLFGYTHNQNVYIEYDVDPVSLL